ncbi:MAG: hypothetical protein ACK6DF_07415, partial [Betaproteobacteria bacterium]
TFQNLELFRSMSVLDNVLVGSHATTRGGFLAAALLLPLVVQDIFRIMRAVNEQERVSILVVEQNARLALDLAGEACLLETGRVVLSGPAARIREDDTVRRAYLGY